MTTAFASALAQFGYEAVKYLLCGPNRSKDADLGQIVYLLETISEKLDILIALQHKGIKYENINRTR